MIFYKVKKTDGKEFRYRPKFDVLNKYKRPKSSATYQEFRLGVNILVSKELVSKKRYNRLLAETTCIPEYFEAPIEIADWRNETYVFFGARFMNEDY